MNCLTTEQLALLLLGDDQPGWRAHAAACPDCAARCDELALCLQKLHDAHDVFHQGHALARSRLLAALARDRSVTPFRPHRKESPMRRFWLVTAAALILGLGLGWFAGPFTPALAEVSRALRDVKTYRCVITSQRPEEKTEKMRLHWHRTGGIRVEAFEGDKLVQTQIAPLGKPGLDIDHVHKTYRALEPDKGEFNAVLMMGELAKYSGKADRTLPAERIARVQTQGFEIELKKVHPDLFDGALRVWINPATKLPVRVQVTFELLGSKNVLQLDDFAWDVPSEGWFDLKPPAGYKDESPEVEKLATLEKQ